MKLLESDNKELVQELEKIHSFLNLQSSSKSAQEIIDFVNG